MRTCNSPRISTEPRKKKSKWLTQRLGPRYEQRLEGVAQKHAVALDTELQQLEDGDIIFLSLPHPSAHPDDWGEKFYGFTEGIISDPMLFGLDDGARINCTLDAIDPGMVFDVLYEGEYPYGLRFDKAATAELREEPAEVDLLNRCRR